MFHGIQLPVLTLDDILHHRLELPRDFHPYAYFPDYLKQGYYPFSRERQFDIRLQQVVTKTLETDIPQYAEMSVATSRKLKRLLTVGISRNSLADYFLYLEEAGLIAQLRDDTGGIRGLGKVDKVYLDNPNLVYALADQTADTGNLRETFFFNQTRVNHDTITSSVPDFRIDDYTFEVGGRNKKQKQLQGIEQGYVVKDDIESGYMNVIPLWQFGLNY